MTARRANAQLLQGQGAARLDAVLRRMAREIRADFRGFQATALRLNTFSDRDIVEKLDALQIVGEAGERKLLQLVDGSVADFNERTRDILKLDTHAITYSADEIRSIFLNSMTSHASHWSSRLKDVLRSELSSNKSANESGAQALSASIDRLTAASESINSRLEQAAITLSRARSQMRELSYRVTGTQRLTFYGWEMGGTAIAYALATGLLAFRLVGVIDDSSGEVARVAVSVSTR